MYRFCAEEEIPHRRCGKLVVAVRESELVGLAASKSGAERMEWRSDDYLREDAEREPEVSGVAGSGSRKPVSWIIPSSRNAWRRV